MRRSPWFLAALLLVAVFVVDPATADCVVVDDAASVKVCSDDNGNTTPDQVGVGVPVAEAKYQESGCTGCPGASNGHANLAAADNTATVVFVCSGVPGQPHFACHQLNGGADSAMAGGWVHYHQNSPFLTCAKVYTEIIVIMDSVCASDDPGV